MKLSWTKPHRVVCDGCGDSWIFSTLKEVEPIIKEHSKSCYHNEGHWHVDAGIDVEGWEE
tara:strand:+ start:950 stop:1129 length:180 start_codon:yes stop_codon:yes gene_type:complete